MIEPRFTTDSLLGIIAYNHTNHDYVLTMILTNSFHLIDNVIQETSRLGIIAYNHTIHDYMLIVNSFHLLYDGIQETSRLGIITY